jgi:hypothetical protein
MKDILMSAFPCIASGKSNILNENISLEKYIDDVKKGTYINNIIEVRSMLEKHGKGKEYDLAKKNLPMVTACCTIKTGHTRAKTNIENMNGFILIDIDDEISEQQFTDLSNDKYTCVIHRSAGGKGVCIFVKINPKKFIESFYDLAQYYLDYYDISIDQSCKDEARARFVSYDPYLYYNPNSAKLTATYKKPKEQPQKEYLFVEDDFSRIINELKGRDICQGEYKRYCDIGFAIASKFGQSGFQYYDAICQGGLKYDAQRIEKDYSRFCKGTSEGITIATFYHYAKEMGVDVVSQKTKEAIEKVRISKATKKQIEKPTELEAQILKIGDSILKQSNNEDLDSKVLAFVSQEWMPIYNEFNGLIEVLGTVLDDRTLNTIAIQASAYCEQDVTPQRVMKCLNSHATKNENKVLDYFKKLEYKGDGYIANYVSLISPKKEINKAYFASWLVGLINNIHRKRISDKISPLTIVLAGGRQGIGKSTWCRQILPKDLEDYFVEGKIEETKDFKFRMCRNIIMYDDEFGGVGAKDVKNFKSVSDMSVAVDRKSYGINDSRELRKVSLLGSTNELDILKDPTGNRRILPIKVESIDYDACLNFDSKAMLAEAYQMYLNGFDWVIRKEEDLELMKQENEEFYENDEMEDIFFNRFSLEPNSNFYIKTVLNKGEILKIFSNTNVKFSKFDLRKIYVKNSMKYDNFVHEGVKKKGFVLYEQHQFIIQETGDTPF